ncbi:SDR family NAD(P)-dependent oxidoreductase [Leifsonia sp. NPDC056824]|uniref:SDR family NAD(P)-dependent oxidoreductase n=1 Tax=Leifsonia sp. NPDC056824 TaxID=3345953 RepID=UPI003677E683
MNGMLSGRAALVTGAAGGIGLAIARLYAASGAAVIGADRDARVVDLASAEGWAAGIVFDAADERSVRDAVSTAGERLGRIDILVASHGILTESPVAAMTLDRWEETLRIDLTSVFLLARAVLPGMLERRDGRIIAVASQLALKGGDGLAHYAAAKAGVIAFVKSLALEVSASGVLVNAIAPGPIETPLVDGISEDWKAAKRAELPLGRFGRPEEVAPAALLLASDPGGNLFVGQTLGPNSGDVMP